MLGDPGQMMSSSGVGGGAAESGAAATTSGGSSSGAKPPSGLGEEISERNNSAAAAGNRWPRQETLALLKIRSDMDAAFRDSSLKGPLWDEVSRKMAELGYHRSSKKCREKFENVFKYHKRTKDGRAAGSKSDGKTYRFFDQLEAFQASSAPPPPPVAAMVVMAPAAGNSPQPIPVAKPPHYQFTVSSAQNAVPGHHIVHPISTFYPPSSAFAPPPLKGIPTNALSYPTSSSTSSDEDIQRRQRKKRKWKEFFEMAMNDVIQKQEEMQRKFLEALEKRERDRTAREEAWRNQEMARIKRERDLLLQERSMATVKDAALIQLLQKISDQNNTRIDPMKINNNNNPDPVQIQVQIPEILSTPPGKAAPPPPPPQPQEPSPISVAPPASMPFSVPTPTTKPVNINASENFGSTTPSRWPKAEIEALIDLRRSLDVKYQDSGPKGPLWEEISAAMRRLGYNRNPKRCKEKWENINKYFKKVKESNKKRPEASKTCPYFQQLDALYKEKAKFGLEFQPESNPNMTPVLARPEQQLPLPPDMDNSGDDFGEEDESGGYDIPANEQPSMAAEAAAAATTTTATSTI